MNVEKFSEAMSEIDSRYVEEALGYKKKVWKSAWVKWGVAAATIFCCFTMTTFASKLFTQPIDKEEPEAIPQTDADQELITKITEELSPYFESDAMDIDERRRLSGEYLKLCGQLLEQLDKKVISVVSPMEFTLIDSEEKVVFDPTVPADRQLQLTGLHRRTMDGYGKIIGASAEEKAMVVSAYVPQRKGGTDGGVDIPLLYIVMYNVNDIENLQDYAFIRGQLMTFEQMGQYKVYEDEQYVCYDVSDLFYTDLRQYVESMISQRSDVYFDEQIWRRVQNIYTYYRENVGTLLGYRADSF